jgi:hypothetical protein
MVKLKTRSPLARLRRVADLILVDIALHFHNMKQSHGLLLLASSFFLLASCATVAMAPERHSTEAAVFRAQPGKAAIYVYRRSGLIGGGIAHPVYLDGRILGNNGPGTFLFANISPGSHIVSAGVTQVPLTAEPDRVYFIRQTSDMTMWGVHTSSVHLVSPEEGKRGVKECEEAASNF